MTARDWVANRLGEFSTYVGGALIYVGTQMNLSGVAPNNQTLQSVFDTVHTWAPVAGAMLMSASTRHP